MSPISTALGCDTLIAGPLLSPLLGILAPADGGPVSVHANVTGRWSIATPGTPLHVEPRRTRDSWQPGVLPLRGDPAAAGLNARTATDDNLRTGASTSGAAPRHRE